MDKYEDIPQPEGQNPEGMNPMDLLKMLSGELPKDPALTAMLNDQRLLKLADYDITKGYTTKKKHTPEEVQDRFSQLKQIILKKESTLAELETLVYNKYGVQEGPRDKAPADELERPQIGFFVDESIAGTDKDH